LPPGSSTRGEHLDPLLSHVIGMVAYRVRTQDRPEIRKPSRLGRPAHARAIAGGVIWITVEGVIRMPKLKTQVEAGVAKIRSSSSAGRKRGRHRRQLLTSLAMPRRSGEAASNPSGVLALVGGSAVSAGRVGIALFCSGCHRRKLLFYVLGLPNHGHCEQHMAAPVDVGADLRGRGECHGGTSGNDDSRASCGRGHGARCCDGRPIGYTLRGRHVLSATSRTRLDSLRASHSCRAGFDGLPRHRAAPYVLIAQTYCRRSSMRGVMVSSLNLHPLVAGSSRCLAASSAVCSGALAHVEALGVECGQRLLPPSSPAQVALALCWTRTRAVGRGGARTQGRREALSWSSVGKPLSLAC